MIYEAFIYSCLAIICGFFLSLWIKYSFRQFENEPIKFHCFLTELNNSICNAIKERVGAYKPPFWYHPAFSVIKWGCNSNFAYEREIYCHDDGTQYEVDWYPKIPTKESFHSGNICIHLPGLGTCSKSKVSQGLTRIITQNGMVMGIIIPRGKHYPLKTSKLWHAGCTDDLNHLLQQITNRFSDLSLSSLSVKTTKYESTEYEEANKEIRILLIGYSASANILSKTMLELTSDSSSYAMFNKNENRIVQKGIKEGKEHNNVFLGYNLSNNVKIMCAVAVSVTYDYVKTRISAEKTFLGFILSLILCRRYKNFIKRNRKVYESIDKLILQKLLNCYLVSQYDELIYSYLGYKTIQECYNHYSSYNMNQMKIPFLAIQPKDDFIQGNNIANNLPIDKYVTSPAVILMTTQYGNHLGFYEGGLWDALSNQTSYTYPGKVALSFFESIIANEKLNIVKEK